MVFFNKIPLDKLTDNLIQEHNFTNGHLEILSELFYAQVELAHAQGEYSECSNFYKKSLILLEYVIKKSKTFSFEKQSKLSFIQQLII